MSTMRDLTGQVFGRLIVVSYAGSDARGQARWWVRCVGSSFCVDGNEKIVRGKSLLCGATKSCGCIGRETTKRRISAASLRDQYVDQGKSATSIAKQEGVATQAVVYWLEADGIAVRTAAQALTDKQIAASRIRKVATRTKATEKLKVAGK